MASMYYLPGTHGKAVALDLNLDENLVFGEVQKDRNGRPYVVAAVKDKEGNYVYMQDADIYNHYFPW